MKWELFLGEIKMIKSKQQQREEAIMDVIKWAYKDKGYYFMSILEMSWHLNNYWYAPLFTKKDIHCEEYFSDKCWAVKSFDLVRLDRMIVWTVNRMKGCKVIKQGPMRYGRIFLKIKIKEND